ncbi:hypothetical protein ABZT43_37855 [Streptomyces sp. NPDC005349]|uniref:hypothetical protein n=1 Tax=Streptomyces sp. NPDC005349 TaxID=3157037 RepID=UPI0033AA2825
MAGLALDVRSTVLGALTPWTVPQGTQARNAVVAGALTTACVINGDTVTGVLHQATWLILAVTLLIVVRVIEGAVAKLTNRAGQCPSAAASLSSRSVMPDISS